MKRREERTAKIALANTKQKQCYSDTDSCAMMVSIAYTIRLIIGYSNKGKM